MTIILIEDSVYKITEKQFSVIQKKRTEIKMHHYPHSEKLETELGKFLDKEKANYKLLGFVQFDYRY